MWFKKKNPLDLHRNMVVVDMGEDAGDEDPADSNAQAMKPGKAFSEAEIAEILGSHVEPL